MIPIDYIFDSIEWEPLDGAELDKLLTGCTVTGAEPIDYPATDGVVIYLRDSTGKALALEVESDPYERDGFFISKGGLPAEAGEGEDLARTV